MAIANSLDRLASCEQDRGSFSKTSLTLMKFLLAIALAASSSTSNAGTCERDLAGTWKSDNKTSMAFIRANTKLQPKTDAFLAALLGHMSLTFSRDELHEFMPDIEVPVSGHLRPFAGMDERTQFRILFCSKEMIVWAAARPIDKQDEATTFNFVGPDTFWVYLGSTEPKIPDLHAREYFQRVQ